VLQADADDVTVTMTTRSRQAAHSKSGTASGWPLRINSRLRRPSVDPGRYR
jgi:hypothetical protein